jgi:hypothetical protein
MCRFALEAASYAAGMLVLGSQMGLIFGTLCSSWFPGVLDP